MTDEEFKTLSDKIEKELPVRLKLAELAGLPKINPKSYKDLEKMDMTIKELYLEVIFRKPENEEAALAVIRELYK